MRISCVLCDARISTRSEMGRLKWYGHVERREEDFVGRRIFIIQVVITHSTQF